MRRGRMPPTCGSESSLHRCNIRCHQCRRYFCCRDEHSRKAKSMRTPHDMPLNRLMIQCRRCGAEQPLSRSCFMCKSPFGPHQCHTCLKFSDSEDIYHCDDCGFCRDGVPKDETVHCFKCGTCHRTDQLEEGAGGASACPKEVTCVVCLQPHQGLPYADLPCQHNAHKMCLEQEFPHLQIFATTAPASASAPEEGEGGEAAGESALAAKTEHICPFECNLPEDKRRSLPKCSTPKAKKKSLAVPSKAPRHQRSLSSPLSPAFLSTMAEDLAAAENEDAAAPSTPPALRREPSDDDEEIILTPPLKGKQHHTPTSLPLASVSMISAAAAAASASSSSFLAKIKMPKEDAEDASEKCFTEESFDLTPKVSGVMSVEPVGAQGEEPRKEEDEEEDGVDMQPKTKGELALFYAHKFRRRAVAYAKEVRQEARHAPQLARLALGMSAYIAVSLAWGMSGE